MAAHRYWRIYVTASNGTTWHQIGAELELRQSIGGADESSVGTASASGQISNDYAASKAFDNTAGTMWNAPAATGRLQFAFATNREVVEYTVAARNDGFLTDTPKNWTFEYSDNGTSWSTAHTVTNATGWSLGEVRTYSFTTVGEHRYWRINVSANNGSAGNVAIAEMELRASSGGADLTTPYPTLTSGDESSFPFINALDNNTSTFHQWLGATLPKYAGVDFGSATKDIVQISITAHMSYSDRCPKDFSIQWSDDGSTWTTAWSVTGQTGWTSGQTRVFTGRYTLAATSGSFAFTGNAATLSYAPAGATYTLATASGSFALTGNTSSLAAGRTLVSAAANYALTGQAASVAHGYALPVASGSFTLSGVAADLAVSRNLAAQTNAFALAGSAAGLSHQYVLTAGSGAFNLAGQGANLVASRTLAAQSGGFALTGQAADLRRGYTLAAESGAFALTGNAVSLTPARKLTAATAGFTLTGDLTDLVYTPASGPTYTLTVNAGTFALTGEAAGLVAARKLAADAQAITLAGNAAGLQAGRRIAAGLGAFDVLGQAVAFRASRRLTAAAGDYPVTGHAATLGFTRRLGVDAGTFSLAGNDVALRAARRLSAAAGSFTLIGRAVSLIYSNDPVVADLLRNDSVFARIGSDTCFARVGSPIAYVRITDERPVIRIGTEHPFTRV